jgi:L-asparaginase
MTKVLIIYTGGTVGMIYDDKTRALRPIGFSEIRNSMPELYRLGFEFMVHPFRSPLDSSNMQPDVWVEIAETIENTYDFYDGFVILHGSDTMSFTASALSFMLENLAKPIILTGSQLPIGEIRTDARENIITAMEIAATKIGDKSLVPEVCIFFDYLLFRGNRSKKYNAEKFEAFYSMNYPSLAEAGIDIKFKTQYIASAPQGNLKVHKKLDTNIAVLKLFPGISISVVDSIIKTPGIKGIILETFGNGNASTAKWFINCLKEAIERGIIILDITQCDGGSVEMGRYETSKYLGEIGVTSGFDMTFEAAITKMMFLFGQGLPMAEVKELLEKPLRGELTRI